MPAPAGRPGAPASTRTTGGPSSWLFEGRAYPNIGLNAVVGRPRDEWSMEPARFEEMRPGCLRHRRPGGRHGPRRDLGLALLPLAGGRVLRRGLLPGRTIPSWAWPAPGRGTTGTPRSGPAPTPSGSSRSSSRGWPTRPSAADGGPGQRRAGVQGGQLPRVPGPARLPLDLHRRTGTRSSPPARRPARWSACTPGPRPGPRCRPPTRPSSCSPRCSRSTRSSPRPSGCGRACPLRFPRPGRGPLRGRDGLGPDAARPGRLRARPLGVRRPRAPLDRRTSGPARCSAETSGSAPSTTRRWPSLRHRIGVDHVMVESDYPHADSTWPDTQAVVHATLGHLPEDELAPWRRATPPRCSAIRSPEMTGGWAGPARPDRPPTDRFRSRRPAPGLPRSRATAPARGAIPTAPRTSAVPGMAAEPYRAGPRAGANGGVGRTTGCRRWGRRTPRTPRRYPRRGG